MRVGTNSAGDTATVRREPNGSSAPRTSFRSGEAAAAGELALHLNELVPIVRSRLRIGRELPDEAVLASLAAINSQSSRRDRWRVAFNSAVGEWLAGRGSDLNTALNLLIMLVPAPRS